MSFLAKAFNATGGLFGGLLGGAASLLGIGGSKKARPVQRPVRRDPEMEAIEEADALRRRKGAAADLITGTRGAEAAQGAIGRLVLGS